jgi:predicted RNA binding protein YcfA (HicA-like mRNA interferase family)
MSPRLPRDLSGLELAKRLESFGYAVTRQKGSHLRLTTFRAGEHHVTVPNTNHSGRAHSTAFSKTSLSMRGFHATRFINSCLAEGDQAPVTLHLTASGVVPAASRGVSTVGAAPLPPTHHADCSQTLS